MRNHPQQVNQQQQPHAPTILSNQPAMQQQQTPLLQQQQQLVATASPYPPQQQQIVALPPPQQPGQTVVYAAAPSPPVQAPSPQFVTIHQPPRQLQVQQQPISQQQQLVMQQPSQPHQVLPTSGVLPPPPPPATHQQVVHHQGGVIQQVVHQPPPQHLASSVPQQAGGGGGSITYVNQQLGAPPPQIVTISSPMPGGGAPPHHPPAAQGSYIQTQPSGPIVLHQQLPQVIYPPQQQQQHHHGPHSPILSTRSNGTRGSTAGLGGYSGTNSLIGTTGEQPELLMVPLPDPLTRIEVATTNLLPPINNPNDRGGNDGASGGRWEVLTMSTICKEFLSGRCKHLKNPDQAQEDLQQPLHSCMYVHLPPHVRAFPQEVCRDYTKPQQPSVVEGGAGVVVGGVNEQNSSISSVITNNSGSGGCRRSHCRMYHGSPTDLEKARNMLMSYGLNPNSVFVRQPEKKDPEHWKGIDPNERPRLSYHVASLHDCVLVYARKRRP